MRDKGETIMNGKKTFKKFYHRLALEGVLKAFMWALVIAFAACFVISFVSWFFPFNGLWLAIAVWGAFTCGFTVLFYFLRFRPTAQGIARRVDSLGLEERLITMAELENDESYIALRQREDAQAHISAFDTKAIKISVSLVLLVVACGMGVLGIGMATVETLSQNGITKGGADIIEELLPPEPEVYYSVSYLVEGEGYIEGEAEQMVLAGGDTTMVVAIPEEGWAFVNWQEDEVENPVRTDKDIRQEMIFTAVFAELGDGENGNGDEEGEESDAPSDQPNPSEGEGEGSGSQPSDPSDQNSPSDGAGGNSDNNDNIIDGASDRKDFMDKEGQLDDLASDGNISDGDKDILGGYMGTL